MALQLRAKTVSLVQQAYNQQFKWFMVRSLSTKFAGGEYI